MVARRSRSCSDPRRRFGTKAPGGVFGTRGRNTGRGPSASRPYNVSVAAGAIAPVHGALTPRHRHRRRATVQVAARVLRPVLEPADETHELLDGLLVDLTSLLCGGQFRLAEDARFAVAARPRDQRRGTGGEQVIPDKRALFLVETDD